MPISIMPVWSLPLDAPPTVLTMGTPVHGQTPSERWTSTTYWSLHAYRYRARLRVDDVWLEIEPGSVSILPAGAVLEYHFRGLSRHVFAHFDPRPSPRAPAVRVPAMLRLGRDFESFAADFTEAVGWLQSQPRRAQARVWDLLWRLTTFVDRDPLPSAAHPLVGRAVEWIELHLAEPFALATLADDLSVSHAHLIRLFRQHLAATPLAYVHARRAQRAEHLLRHTTLSIKSIAMQVGLVDLQQLNKLMRRTLGQSPRALRTGRPGRSTPT